MESKDKDVRRRRYPSLMWPVLLIVTGVILILGYLGVLNVSFWQLWRLWPLLLILIGLDLLFGRSSLVGNLAVLLITLAVVAGLIVLLIASPDALGSVGRRSTEEMAEPLGDAERADLRLDLPAGTLRLGRLEDSPSVVEGTLKTAGQREPDWDVDRSGGIVTLTLERGSESRAWAWGGDEWDLGASPQVGLSVEAELGAGKAEIDLTGLDIRDLEVHAGVGQIQVVFPEAGDFRASVSGGVGQVELELPESLAVRLRIDRGLSTLNIDDRFERDGDIYSTSDWDTNPNKVDIRLDIGLGLLTIR